MPLSIQKSIDNIFDDAWEYNDGGRSKTKWRGTADCGVRAMSIVCDMPYEKARRILKSFGNIGLSNDRRISKGVHKCDMDMAMESLGWFYQDAPKFTGRKAYCFDIPNDIIALCNMPKHFVAIKNGVLLDTWDSSSRNILGYWVEL